MARKNSLRPIEQPVVKEPVDSQHITEESSIDDYIDAMDIEKKEEFKESEKDEMTNEILELRDKLSSETSERERLENENRRLLSELQQLREKLSKADYGHFVGISAENETLKMINSTLQYEKGVCQERIRSLVTQMDNMKHVYTRTPYDGRFTVMDRKNTPNVNNNGYQDWI